jgi:hypothetical protein
LVAGFSNLVKLDPPTSEIAGHNSPESTTDQIGLISLQTIGRGLLDAYFPAAPETAQGRFPGALTHSRLNR